MKVRDLPEDQIVIGLRIQSLDKDTNYRHGTVVAIDPTKYNLAWVQWDGEVTATSGFYGNHCHCPIVGGPLCILTESLL